MEAVRFSETLAHGARTPKEHHQHLDIDKLYFVSGESNQLDLEGPLYIGGVGPPTAPLTVPPVLWAGVLRHGYVGCMRDLVINGNAIDIAGYARRQDSGTYKACDIFL